MVIAKKTENEAWFRGYGAEQYVYYAIKGPKKFLGGVFAVDSKEEFEKYDAFSKILSQKIKPLIV